MNICEKMEQYGMKVEKVLNTNELKGEWIVKHGSHGHMRISWYACSQCGSTGDISNKTCKHCGAKMER